MNTMNMLSALSTLRYTTNSTPDGEFHIIIDDHDAALASGFGDVHALRARLPAVLAELELEAADGHPYGRLIDAYYEGEGDALGAIPAQQSGTDFQCSVWKAISGIPYGATMSYRQLAEAAGHPTAIRAAGSVCRINRLVLLVPCHRVITSGGGIGNYRYGKQIKESLLRRERALLAMR